MSSQREGDVGFPCVGRGREIRLHFVLWESECGQDTRFSWVGGRRWKSRVCSGARGGRTPRSLTQLLGCPCGVLCGGGGHLVFPYGKQCWGAAQDPLSAEHLLQQDSTWQRYASCTGLPGQVSGQTGTTLHPIASSVLLARPPLHSVLPRSACSPLVLPASTQHYHPPGVLQ